jgi:hypothetical protein
MPAYGGSWHGALYRAMVHDVLHVCIDDCSRAWKDGVCDSGSPRVAAANQARG